MDRDKVYIHLRPTHWRKEKAGFTVPNSEIQAAFLQQKNRYWAGEQIMQCEAVYHKIFHYIQGVHTLDPNILNGVYQDYLDVLVKEFEQKLLTKFKFAGSSKSITNIGWMSNSDLTELLQAQGGSAEKNLFKFWHDVKVAFEELEQAAAYLKLETGKGTLSFSDFDKLRTIQKNLDDVLNITSESEVDLNAALDKTRSVSHNMQTAWPGGFNEFFNNLSMAMRENILQELIEVDKIKGVEVVKENVGAEYEEGHRSKADNAIVIDYLFNGNKDAGKVFLGISEKSGKIKTYGWKGKGKAGRSSLMGATSYEQIFSGIENINVEHYFCNEAVHDRARFMNRPQNSVQRYITAKAASYALSGGNDSKLAYFLHAGDQLVYIPKLLERLADQVGKTKTGILRLSVSGLSALNKNKPKSKDESPEARSERLYQDVKSKAKFSMGVGSDIFWDLMGI